MPVIEAEMIVPATRKGVRIVHFQQNVVIHPHGESATNALDPEVVGAAGFDFASRPEDAIRPMLIHPGQIEPSHTIYTPSAEEIEWAEGVKKVFEEEGIAKGSAAVSYKGKMVDTPVYENALTILRTIEEITAAEAKIK